MVKVKDTINILHERIAHDPKSFVARDDSSNTIARTSRDFAKAKVLRRDRIALSIELYRDFGLGVTGIAIKAIAYGARGVFAARNSGPELFHVVGVAHDESGARVDDDGHRGDGGFS